MTLESVYKVWKLNVDLEKTEDYHYSSCTGVCDCKQLSNHLQKLLSVLQRNSDLLSRYLSLHYDDDFRVFIMTLDESFLIIV